MQEIQILEEYRKLLPNTLTYIGLIGSQNYNLNTENSDYDCIAVINLTLEEFILGKRISGIKETPKGNIILKDIISFMELLEKGTPNYVECSHTDYWIGSQEFRNIIQKSKINPLALKGMFHSYFKKLEKSESPEEIKKMFCNCVRVYRNSLNLEAFYVFGDDDEVKEMRLSSVAPDKENMIKSLNEIEFKFNSQKAKNNLKKDFLNFIKNSF